MEQKPISPQKEHVSVVTYLFAIVFFIIAVNTYVNKWCEQREDELYNSNLLQYKNAASKYSSELYKYQTETIAHILSINSSYPIRQNGSIPVEISVQCNRETNSQYIGSELSYYFKVNGTSIQPHRATAVYINPFQEITFESEIIENDPSDDDVGQKKEKAFFNFLEINKGINHTDVVRVRENYGLEAGHVAIFQVTYTITPKVKLYLTDEQKNSFPERPLLPEEPSKGDYSIEFWSAVKEESDIHTGIAIIAIVDFAFIVFMIISKHLANKKNEANYIKAMNDYDANRINFTDSISGQSIRELAGVPDTVSFTSEELPYDSSQGKKYGSFTLYITPSGNCYHTDMKCCRSNKTMAVNLVKLSNRYKPCSKCAKDFDCEIPSWYLSYMEYKRKIKQYEIKDYIE